MFAPIARNFDKDIPVADVHKFAGCGAWGGMPLLTANWPGRVWTHDVSQRRIKVFFDGGARPNPGRIEVAVVIRGQAHVYEDLGQGSSHDAEWLALIRALELCQAQGLTRFVLIGDALAVIEKANQAINRGSAPDGHAATFLALTARSRPAHIRWMKRQQNLAGIVLAARHPR